MPTYLISTQFVLPLEEGDSAYHRDVNFLNPGEAEVYIHMKDRLAPTLSEYALFRREEIPPKIHEPTEEEISDYQVTLKEQKIRDLVNEA
jgi:hypothetical protein